MTTENQLLTLSLKPRTAADPVQRSRTRRSNQTQMGIGENRDLEDSSPITVNHDIAHSNSSFTYKYLDGTEEDEEVSTVTTQIQHGPQGAERDVQQHAAARRRELGHPHFTGELPGRDRHISVRGCSRRTSRSSSSTPTNLSSQYGIDYSQTTVGGEDTDLTALQASLTHQLYQSLFSPRPRLRLVTRLSTGPPRISEGVALSENYRKRIPWGTLTVDAGGGYSVTDDQTQPGLNSVVNESQTLSDTTPLF